MQPVRRAVIDIGTNSVKLLVADVAGREVRPVCEQSHQTRLGQGFYETRRLRPEAMEATAQAVAGFAAGQAESGERSQSFHPGVNLRAQSAARAPERLLPFF